MATKPPTRTKDTAHTIPGKWEHSKLFWTHFGWWPFSWCSENPRGQTSGFWKIPVSKRHQETPNPSKIYFSCGLAAIVHPFRTDSFLSWWTNTTHLGRGMPCQDWAPREGRNGRMTQQHSAPIPVLNILTYSNTSSRGMKLSNSFFPYCYPCPYILIHWNPPQKTSGMAQHGFTSQIFGAGTC